MADFYGDTHRALQDRFDTRRLADGLRDVIVRDHLNRRERRYLETRDFFFLASVDPNGWPTVSYKGGFPGFVKVLDERTLAFPSYDGNGMFYSIGNLAADAKLGLLFIDFVKPRRLRVHGTATIGADDPLLADYPEAQLVIRVAIENVFTNCARYIHRHERIEQSPYVPRAGRETAIPDWKRLEFAQPLLPERDKDLADKAGGVLSEKVYRDDFWEGMDEEPT